MTPTLAQLNKEIQKKNFAPVYIFYGEEPYYIDALSDYLIKHVLNDIEKEFNQTILYGRDTNLLSAVNLCKQFPMVGEKQLVVVREGQDMDIRKEDNYAPLLIYSQTPQPSTVFVFNYKYKTPPAKLLKACNASQNVVVFESKRKKDNEIPEWITEQVRNKGFSIAPKACAMILEFLGNDLEKIMNELNKLYINHAKDKIISEDIIEKNIGISKDYNVFELINALATKNITKTNRIVYHFAANEKDNPIFMILPNLFSFFNKLLAIHSMTGKPEQEIASALKLNYYQKNDYLKAAQIYSTNKLLHIISWIRECNTRALGIDNYSASSGELLKELTTKIIYV